MSSSCEAAGKELDTGNHQPCFGAGNGRLEVLGEAPVASKPGEGALHHPSAWFRLEGSDTLSSCDDLDGPFAEVGDRVEQLFSPVNTVGEDMPQLGEATAERFEQWHGAVIVLNIGRVHESSQQPTFGIGDDVTLAAFHLLGHVKPPRAAAFRGLHTLAVNDAGRRRCPASDGLASQPNEIAIDPMPGSVVTPAIEVTLNRRARWKILGHRPPLAAGRQNVKNRVYNEPQINLPRPPQIAWLRHERCHNFPLVIGHVACIDKAIAPILRAGDFSPRHVVLRRSLTTTTESQRTEITQLIFSGQTFRMRAEWLSGRHAHVERRDQLNALQLHATPGAAF